MQDLAIQSDLSVTTLRRFLEDGELSTSATMRLAHAMGLVHRMRVSDSDVAILAAAEMSSASAAAP